MFTHSYPVLSCFCCPSITRTTSNSYWYIYKTCVQKAEDGHCIAFSIDEDEHTHDEDDEGDTADDSSSTLIPIAGNWKGISISK